MNKMDNPIDKDREAYIRKCKHYSPYTGECFAKSGSIDGYYYNLNCNGKCRRMRNYDKKNGL